MSVALTPDGKWALTGSQDYYCTPMGSYQILVVVLVFFRDIRTAIH